MSRREKIEAMLADDPQDTFLRYSLAMELDKEGDTTLASHAARRGLTRTPLAVRAGVLHGRPTTGRGSTVSNDSRDCPARRASRKPDGQGDAHAAGEMSEFLASLGDLGE